MSRAESPDRRPSEHRSSHSPLGTRRATLKSSSASNTPRADTLPRLSSLSTELFSAHNSPAQSPRAAAILSAAYYSPPSTVHPPLTDIAAVEEYIAPDPSALVQLAPALAQHLAKFCLTNPADCSEAWSHVETLLQQLERIAAARAEQDAACVASPRPASPECPRKPTSAVNVHGETWTDDYAWLTDRENPEVLKYIEEENAYSTEVMEHTKPLQKLLYTEFVGRVDEGEHSPRVTLQDGWTYYTKKVPGQEYRLHCRTRNGIEDVYLDENLLAASPEFENASYFHLGFLKHSPDCGLVAYGIDASGNERHTTYFMSMADGDRSHDVLPDRIEGVYEDLEFAKDNSVFYTLLDDTERAYKFMRHRLGTDVSADDLLYHEEDEMFFLSLTKTCNGKYILLNSSAQITSETRCVSTERPDDPPIILFARRENIRYSCESHEDYIYVLTNEASKNNWLFRIPVAAFSDDAARAADATLSDHRETVIEHRDFVLIEGFELRRQHLIVLERSNCLQNVRIVDLSYVGFNAYHYMSFGETVYSLWPGTVREEERSLAKASHFDTHIFRFTYTSFIQPKQVVDYDMAERTMTVVYEEHIAGYDPSLYASKRLFATGVDGTTVPVSIVYRRDMLGQDAAVAGADGVEVSTGGGEEDVNVCDEQLLPLSPSAASTPGTNPCLLHAYGAYGAFVNPIFSSSRLSLLDRGFIYAAAHVRGGADMGNGWYEEGKLAKKPNTFLDFCSVAEHLCKERYTTPAQLAIYGRSAGGLLIGAAINMRPDLFAAALTEVPFVDVVNTMFDSSIPWTAFEWEEWGNPMDRDIYDVMKLYCPYTNIRGEALARNAYPHLLVVGGMNDPRVAFFEPLKFVAKMRGERRRFENGDNIASKKNHDSETGKVYSLAEMAGGTAIDAELPSRATRPQLLLRIDDAGHGGSSGQYSFLESLAFEYAFLVAALGAPLQPAPSGSLSSVHVPTQSAMGSRRNTVSRQQWVDPAQSADALNSTDSLAMDSRGGTRGGVGGRRKKGGQDAMADADEKEYRRKAKGDRGPNTLFQWVTNFF
ncbi:hypothetical protein HDU86_006954 [Geranomyces michiganensis]|nr:hypothetical protein HDU86_006954 [Geranomyces michiganensis]